MAPSRRQISGRSPLVNQQRQITAFFGKSASSSSTSPSPAPSLFVKKTPKSNPNPNSPSPSPSPPKKTPKFIPYPSSLPPARSPSPIPATPSPLQSKLKKPLLVIGQTPSPPKSAENTYRDEVVGKQVRVYWPLDQRWYEGSVTSYDKGKGKHTIEYDDGEEESLDLGKEKIDWLVGAKSGDRFKRLRRGASAFRKVVMDDNNDDDVDMSNVEEENEKENKSEGDDSSDEDWGKNVGKEVCESEEDDVELDDENEMDENELEEEKDEETLKVNRVSKTDSRKRKTSEVAESGKEKKSRTNEGIPMKSLKATAVEPAKKIEEGKPLSD